MMIIYNFESDMKNEVKIETIIIQNFKKVKIEEK